MEDSLVLNFVLLFVELFDCCVDVVEQVVGRLGVLVVESAQDSLII